MNRIIRLTIAFLPPTFLLSGCTDMEPGISSFLKIVTGILFAFFILGGLVVMFSNDRERRINAITVGGITIFVAVLLSLLLIA